MKLKVVYVVLVLYGLSATRIGDQEHLGPWGGLRLSVEPRTLCGSRALFPMGI